MMSVVQVVVGQPKKCVTSPFSHLSTRELGVYPTRGRIFFTLVKVNTQGEQHNKGAGKWLESEAIIFSHGKANPINI